MSISVKITFGDLSKRSINADRYYSRECWQRCASKMFEQHKRVPIRLGSNTTERDVGYAELVYFSWPEAIFEGEIYSEEDHLIHALENCSFSFTAKGNVKYETNSASYVHSMEIICLNPSIVPTFESRVKILSTLPDANKSKLKCDSCGESFETFEYIVEYDGKLYHENCFFDLAIEKLNAKQHHLDSSGRIPEPDDLEDAGNQPTAYTDLIRKELYEIFGVPDDQS